MVAPGTVKKSKSHLAGALLLIGLFLIGGPYVLSRIGVAAPVKDNAWVIQVIAFAGILLKSGISFMATFGTTKPHTSCAF